MNMYPFAKRCGNINCFTLSQNGVGDGRMHSTHIPVGLSLPSHNGNDGSSDAPKRPKSLGVTPTNGYSPKTYRLSDGSVDGNSLPCSPELLSPSELDESSADAADGNLKNDTRELIRIFLTDFTGLSKSNWGESKPLATMKRVVEDVLAKHRLAYNGMINKLSLDNGDMGFVSNVATSLFSDGNTNWGRIASLVAFGAAVCQNLKEKGRESCVELVAEEISTYLLNHQKDWLIKNNSWDGFVQFFRVSDPESTIRNTLLAFVGVAGIGALALLSR